MDKIKLEILGLSSSQSQSGSFALVLGEERGNRRLPIIIGMFEAQAIAIEIEKIVPNRPMTHDLFKSFAQSFKFSILEIVISDLREGVFYAKIVCTDGVKMIDIDARPSDAIAIGLRFGVPIYTFEPILSEAGIVLTEPEEDETLVSKDEETKKNPVKKSGTSEQLKDISSDQLKTMLDEALEKEDYERAAKIRDELNKRN
ncbi:bifunctional nuclease family protein [Cytophagaceae bacterium DM2B3-1]|uniref:Bifunctional nuclease family protein n=2 Tax=Xanthocytophaga TaxID=3078918 RepID=A0AAE3QI45_9BACT|nr:MULTISPECIES: bifunctional nuclease family protein [Xanthocytophaga]MDJ1466389.1 bifunctional nuclease family protein [Xanthocytophaga flavus]MDJ1479046.1 bifunctional nuclease family protein [Xanthocytophaga flavus]MDJ1497896.1 bifunctional nuclease family protein [Xanthocytophaga flavus]MDJ1500560.1 bifunctional nuclease family protein [Xanthocytophaga agilis]